MYPDYKNSILNVTATLLKHYHADSIYPSIEVLEKSLKQSYDHIVYMLLDGMGINIINKHLEPHDFLRKQIKKVITSVYPPTTVAATNTVLSGLPPYSTGYLGWVQYFKHEDTNCAVFLNSDFYDSSKKFDYVLRDKYLKYQTIYEQITLASPSVKTYELFPSFRENGFESFELQIKRLKTITSLDEKNFTYVYWTDPDMTEHDFGIDSIETQNVLRSLNHQVELFANEMNEKTLLVIIADHGLIDVKGINLFEDEKLLGYLIRKPSIEPRTTNFFVKSAYKNHFKNEFDKKYGKLFKLMTRLEFLESNLLGYGKKHPMLQDFLGDYIAVAIDSYMFNMNEESSFKAHHAGLTKKEMEVPLIIYHNINKKGLK
jgi:hypothetical protein